MTEITATAASKKPATVKATVTAAVLALLSYMFLGTSAGDALQIAMNTDKAKSACVKLLDNVDNIQDMNAVPNFDHPSGVMP
jgi:hypothetical protein